MFQPQKILVTGGAGFIGSNFIHYLLKADPQVTIINLDLLTYAADQTALTDLDSQRHHLIVGDIADRELVEQLLREHNIDTVVHFAAESHVDRSISGPAAFIHTNIVGTFTLLEACRHAWEGKNSVRFHHVSTDEVYGTLSRTDPPFTEKTPYSPNSPYSASKASSDHLVRAYFHTYKLPVVTTNCSNNYGPFQHDEKFIPTVIRNAFYQRPIPIYGDGSNIRDWLYVEDHCRGIHRVLTAGIVGETYNIGGHNEWANLRIAEMICHLLDEFRPQNAPHNGLLTFVTDRPGHDWRYAIDAQRMESELQWRPNETFETGIRKTVQWYLQRYETRHAP